MDSLNGSTTDSYDEPWFVHDCTLNLDQESRRIALFLLYLLFFMAGLLENGMVLWVSWRRRHSASNVLLCVLNLTASDTMVVLVMPFFMLEVMMDHVWLWGRFLCKVTYLVFGINFYSSSFFVAYMSLERYRALTSPPPQTGAQAERRRCTFICVGLWVFSLFLTLLENVHVDLLEWDEPGCYMMPEDSHREWFISITFLNLILQFLVPASVIVTCNVLIARAAHAAPDIQGGRRDVWLVHVYSLVFLACWLPYHLVVFLMTVDTMGLNFLSCNAADVLYFSFSLVHVISLSRCVANPILYNFLSKSFRVNMINAILERIPRAPTDNTASDANQVGGGQPSKERKLSNTSTSHSDILS